jgi:predicted MFS family arabinose efflux permease
VGTSNYVDRQIIGVVLEPIKAEFKVSDTMLGLLSGLSFALLYSTLGIPLARYADRGNRKHLITISLGVWSVMTALCGVAQNFWQLMAARFGVGAGEAGAIPPAQSLIADYFPAAERARALAIFIMSSSFAYVIGLIFGAWFAQQYGWRATFVFFGVAGLFLLPLTHFFLAEPRKLLAAQATAQAQESIKAAMSILYGKRSYRSLVSAMVVYYFMGYGAFVFIVSLMVRVHGLTLAEAGLVFGSVFALGAVIGSLAGGRVADSLALKDVAWLPRIAAIGFFACVPVFAIAFWTSDIVVMAVLLFVGAIIMNGTIPPHFAAIHVVCGSPRRALAVALMYFFANLIGLGLGPVAAGALSDAFAAVHGPAEGLRYAMIAVLLVLFVASGLLFHAARYLRAEEEA